MDGRGVPLSPSWFLVDILFTNYRNKISLNKISHKSFHTQKNVNFSGIFPSDPRKKYLDFERNPPGVRVRVLQLWTNKS